MIEEYYAAHIKTSLDAAAINVMRPKKGKARRKVGTDRFTFVVDAQRVRRLRERTATT